ncbi:hypothetical protein [Bifidobacterium sp. UTBIF-78]|uniref:hypothetical protein n=1 Tax=Bifidobacterium sp. UTBIF-78 TaxID=1465263 RepID=UPI0011283B16|nr:hypothetical protein [Bifidobacterium sp. UTBIF-78]
MEYRAGDSDEAAQGSGAELRIKAASMAERLEKTANEMAQRGYESVIFSVTNSAKAIAVFSIGKTD